MFKKFLTLMTPGPARKKAPTRPEKRIIPRDQHTISRRDISEPAKKVLNRLNQSGYEAYLVGGGVRDLLLGKRPKDFDVATNATPEEVNGLFRNSRLIGRRFRIVHVRFGREIIEVTTFRGGEAPSGAKHHRQTSDEGLLLRDNVYGNQEEDALRRDFTINALYYCIRDFSVHDFAGGIDDLHAGQIRLIGDPETRYREDPVRMLRAIRFAVKLGFRIAPETEAPIPVLADLLAQIPPARLFEEVLKLFTAGHAEETYQQLHHYGLLPILFPATAERLEAGASDAVIRQALANTDRRIREDKPVTPYFLYAALLWPVLTHRWEQLQNAGEPPIPALHQAANEVIQEQLQATSLPRRFAVPMREIWELQARLPKRRGRRAEDLLSHPRFRAAYDFLLVRERAGEATDGLGDWWTRFQDADPETRSTMVNGLASKGPRKKRRRRKPASNDN